MQLTVKASNRGAVYPLTAALGLLVLLAGGAHAAPECLPDFDPAPYASGCGSVDLAADPVPGGATLTVQVNVGEDPNGPCGVGTYRVSASYALDTVLLDGAPVVATQHGDAGTYGYGSPVIAPVSGPVIEIPPGPHTVVFTLHPNTPDDCVHGEVGSFDGERRLAGPWVVLSQNSGRWSTPVPFVTESAAACGNDEIDPATEQCDPPGGSCGLDCQCTSTCGNRRIERPCEQCDPPWRSCTSECRCANTCGDSRVELPCETCDLGTRNGTPGSGCSATCQVTGLCSGTGAECAGMADCPEREHCCGNARYELGEECDDGNRLDLDCCSSACRVESSGPSGTCDDDATSCTSDADCPGGGTCHAECIHDGCEAYGPHVVPLTSRFLAARSPDPLDPTRLQLWATKGRFPLPPRASFEADSRYFSMRIVDTDGSEVAGPSLLPQWCPPASSCFRPPAAACPKRWIFSDPDDAVSLADDMQFARFVQRLKPTGECKRSMQFRIESNDHARARMPAASRMRQTIEVGDICATAILECAAVLDVGIDCRSLR